MMDIAVIGKSDFTMGFRLAGVRKTYDVRGEKDLEERIRQCMVDSDVGIVVLHEKGQRYEDSLVVLRLKDFQAWFGDVAAE